MKTVALVAAGAVLAWAGTVAETPQEVDAAIKAFKDAYAKAGKDSAARAAAAKELGKTPHAKSYKVLAQLLGGDGTGQETAEVRIAAADTIGRHFAAVPGAWAGPAAVARNRDRKIVDVRIAAARAVADLAQPDSLKTQQAWIDDKPFELAREAVRGLGAIPDRGSVPMLIKLLREVERVPEDEIVPGLPFHGLGAAGGVIVDDARAEQRARREVLLKPVQDTLARLTGQTDLKTYKEYQQWWSKSGAAFRVKEGK